MNKEQNTNSFTTVITAGFIEKPLRAINREFATKISSEIKKQLHLDKKSVVSQELNTWLLHQATISRKISEEEINQFEESYQRHFAKYHKLNVVKLLKRNLERNRELKETSTIIHDFLAVYNQEYEQPISSMLKDLQVDLPKIVQESVSKNIVIIWQINNSFRFHFNDLPVFEFTKEDLSNTEFTLINLLDKAILFNFFSVWADPTIKLIQNLNTTLSLLFRFLMNHDKARLDDNHLFERFILYIRIIVAKLSSLEQTIAILSRIYSLHEVLKKELLKIADVALLDRIHLRETFESQNSISKVALNLLNSLEEKTNYSKDHLRDYSKGPLIPTTLEQFKEGYDELIVLTTRMFAQAEKLKLWTEKFIDVPYFTFSSDLFQDHLQQIKEIQMDPSIILSVSGLFKTYNLGSTTVYAIRGMSLDIKKGEFLVIFGTSGAGKTTLLNCIAGLDSPDKGIVYFRGKNLHKMNDKEKSNLRLHEMGFIFQNYALLPHYTAKENVTLPSDLAGLSHDLRQRINDLLAGVGINMQEKQFPAQLSGGQMQRVGIARALTNQPTIIFADEPTGDLDSVTGKQVMDLLKKFHDETGTTIVVITHDQSVADYATRIVKVNDGIIVNDTGKS